MSERWHVYLTGGQKIAWALDEDLWWVKWALGGYCQWASLPQARIVHAAWPAGVNAIPWAALRGKTVVCQADNPPAFYLGVEGFAEAVAKVGLWIARTSEALAQFRCLGLPVVLVPYCVDHAVFRRLSNREEIRRSLGIAEEDFVIGNFHRDSEGSDLAKPKRQKGPDILLEVAKELNRCIPHLVVLLAGPRRHWLLRALRAEGIRVVFAGDEPGDADDYKKNILPRKRLNELYQVLDVCVIGSRWEGGPYSVLEALAAGTAVISTPVGTSRDVLSDECRFTNVEEAVNLLERHAKERSLAEFCRVAAEGAARTHSPEALKTALLAAYETLPAGGVPFLDAVSSAKGLLVGRLCRQAENPSTHIAEIVGRVHGRVAEIGRFEGAIDYRDDGTLESLENCAAQIVAARKL